MHSERDRTREAEKRVWRERAKGAHRNTKRHTQASTHKYPHRRRKWKRRKRRRRRIRKGRRGRGKDEAERAISNWWCTQRRCTTCHCITAGHYNTTWDCNKSPSSCNCNTTVHCNNTWHCNTSPSPCNCYKSEEYTGCNTSESASNCYGCKTCNPPR